MSISSLPIIGILAGKTSNEKGESASPPILRTLEQHCHEASAIAGAILFIQIPAFLARYKADITSEKDTIYQNLYQKVIDCQKYFRYSSKSVNEWNILRLAKTCVNRYKSDASLTDPDATSFEKGLNRVYHQTIEALSTQWENLADAYRDLNDASPLTRPLAFIKHYNHTFAKKVWSDYQLDFPISTDTLFWGLGGAFLSSSLFTIAYHTITHKNNKKGGDNHD